ncbi:MAG: response regulator [Lachnospiraceae bacterium]|nr:response regulator [Lachnospiraceae bacterium]
MNKTYSWRRHRTVYVLAFFALALVVVGIVLRTRIALLLDSYTERQTEKQIKVYALLMEEKLNTELENLEYIASRLEQTLDDMDDLMPVVYHDPGIRQGLLGIDGNALYGKSLDPGTYEGIQASFRGNKAITYVENEGMLFTCPVFHGPNIRYVLYRLCPSSVLESYFSTDIYDDLGKICVTTRDGVIVIPFYHSDAADLAWYQSEEIQRSFVSMHREMEVSVAVANTFSTERGDMILFESEIPGTDFLVSGYVPKSVASEGIGNITLLVVWVFGLLMLLVMIGAVYLSRAVMKARESDELRKAKAEAEEASRAKGDFLANMSHEIRTPINAVLGMNEMILRETTDENILTYAENVRSSGHMLLGLINDILDFSKIEAGKIEIIPVEYDLSVVLYDLVTMVRARADDKGLTVNLDFDTDIPRQLFGDEVRIKQVLTNILTNAVKYTEKGSITFSVGYEQTEENQILLYVSVADTGIGIRPEDMGKLFSKFDRIEEKRNRHIEGTGLGMSITENLLELMGTTLQVESTYGKGSTFRFSLLQGVQGEEKLGDFEKTFRSRAQHEHYQESFTAPSAQVLAIDDNPMNLAVFNSLIKKTRVQTDNAASGDEGLALMAQKKYDLIFLDHMMPEKDGVETLHELKAQTDNPNRETPVICLTANAVSGAREEYLQAGFDDYLTKPIDPAKLERMMRRFLPDEKITYDTDEEEQSDTDSAGTKDEDGIPEELNRLAVFSVDADAGIRNSGTVDAYLSLLRMFAASIDERTGELTQLLDEKDYEDYTIKVHALKSSARIIGASSLGEEAQALEDAGKRLDTAYITGHHDEFVKAVERLKEPLSNIFAGPGDQGKADGSDKPPADAALLSTFYKELDAAADAMDCDALQAVFDKIDRYRIPDDVQPLWQKLKHAAQEYDYEGVHALLH